MAKKETKKYRFNYVMTAKERLELQFLFQHHKVTYGRVETIGSIMRKLVSDEVKRLVNNP